MPLKFSVWYGFMNTGTYSQLFQLSVDTDTDTQIQTPGTEFNGLSFSNLCDTIMCFFFNTLSVLCGP